MVTSSLLLMNLQINKFKHKCPAEEHSVRFLNLVDVSRLKATWPDSTLLAHFRSKPFLKLVQCMY